MGWSMGYDSTFQRFVGYGVKAICDYPGCSEEIDRGLAYVCGGQAYGGDRGCGLHFCPQHGAGYVCERCEEGKEPFEPKPDTDEWISWMATDESWAGWRKENGIKGTRKQSRSQQLEARIEKIRALEKQKKIASGLWGKDGYSVEQEVIQNKLSFWESLLASESA